MTKTPSRRYFDVRTEPSLPSLYSRQPLIPVFKVAVTFTADQFGGIYREGKQYHQPDYEEVLKRSKVC